MVDVVVTPANVLSQPDGTVVHGTSAVSIGAGQVLYSGPSDGKWRLADSNVAPPGNIPHGIALHASAINQPIAVHTAGPINLGATLVPGMAYYLSETPGGFQPADDLGAGENVAQIGLAISATILDFRVTAPGVIL